MKKILAVALALMVMLSLAACAKTPGYTRGTWKNDVYTNNTANFTFKLPEGFTLSTDEELMAMIDLGQEVLTEDMRKNYDSAVASALSFYDFAISNQQTSTSLMFMVENLSKSLGGTSMTSDVYLDVLEEQLLQVETLGYVLVGRTNETIGGSTYGVLEMSAMDGMFSQKYYVRKEGTYMLAFIGTYASSEKAAYDAVVASLTKI